MAYWFTADTHFGHTNIVKYQKRPFKSVEQMDEIIIKKWNERVKPNDTVFHLGDFSFKGGYQKYKQRLNGNIILLHGNHDDDVSIIEDMTIEHGGKMWYMIHIPPEIQEADFCLCGHIHKEWKIKRDGNKVMVNVGVDVWDYSPISIHHILKAIQTKKEEL